MIYVEVLRMVYFAYFHSVIKYGVILWGNSTNICRVFTLQKRIIRIMSGVRAENSWRNLFKKLDILRISCQYILSLIMFIVDNKNNFQVNVSVHRLNTRNENKLHLPVANLSCCQVFPTVLWSLIVYQIMSRILGMTGCI